MKSSTLASFSLLALAAVFGGCDDDDGAKDGSVMTRDGGGDTGTTTDASAGPDTSTADTGPSPDGVAFPSAPTLGAQIDRMGRAGVNTALTDPFWDDGTQTSAGHKIQQDKYNQASDPAAWKDVLLATGKTVGDAIKGNLAAFDALDGSSDGTMANDGCGNQLAYNATVGGMNYPNYTLLAAVLTDDRLYVNTAGRTCNTYLAVEANVLGVTNNDCGGRTPTYNTIDITYSALAAGVAVCQTSTTCPVSSGVKVDPDTGSAAPGPNFPYLGDPTP